MKIAYLPIDSRPCNALFPAQLLAAAGASCAMPAMAEMDCFRRPSRHAAIAGFLARETPGADVLILSADQLAYGSLLASREPDVPEAEALARLEAVAALRARNPALRIIAFSVIMRASISTLRAGDLAHHEAVTAYSQASHRAALYGGAEDVLAADRLRLSIPAEILDKYHRVRARNHAVNRACVALVARGVIDRLLLLQEDAQPYGFHRLEQEALADAIARDGLGDRVALHNGTDEGGCLCAALAAGRPLRLHVRELGGGDCGFVAKYEDRPFRRNIESHCRFAGIGLTGPGEADAVLCVLTPPGPQEDVPGRPLSPADAGRIDALAAELASLMDGGRPVALLDVYYANGGMAAFMDALAARADPLRLCAYAAWNTASNALGTVLAQLALGVDERANRLFTVERLLDDLLYQGVARERLQEGLRALGEDILNLTDVRRADGLLAREMADAVARSPALARHAVEYRCRLPWPRTFEVEMYAMAVDGQRR